MKLFENIINIISLKKKKKKINIINLEKNKFCDKIALNMFL